MTEDRWDAFGIDEIVMLKGAMEFWTYLRHEKVPDRYDHVQELHEALIAELGQAFDRNLNRPLYPDMEPR